MLFTFHHKIERATNVFTKSWRGCGSYKSEKEHLAMPGEQIQDSYGRKVKNKKFINGDWELIFPAKK